MGWASGGFGGAIMEGVAFTSVETGLIVSGAAVFNFALVSTSYETGVLIGSFISEIPVYGADKTVGEWWSDTILPP
jgi:hypothetical protein